MRPPGRATSDADAPGWYPEDPRLRRWNGTTWSTAGSVRPVPAEVPRPRVPWRVIVLAVVGLAVATLGGCVGLLLSVEQHLRETTPDVVAQARADLDRLQAAGIECDEPFTFPGESFIGPPEWATAYCPIAGTDTTLVIEAFTTAARAKEASQRLPLDAETCPMLVTGSRIAHVSSPVRGPRLADASSAAERRLLADVHAVLGGTIQDC